MNRLFWLGMLALAGCGGDRDASSVDGGTPDVSLAANGHEAAQRFARAYCERATSCSEELEYGVPWASVAACADGMARLLTHVDVATSCEVTDVAVEPSELAACLEQMQKLDCTILYGEGAAVDGLERKLVACRTVLEEFDRVRLLARRGVMAAAGEPCGAGIFCETGSACDADIEEADACGRCVAAPLEGEPCVYLGDDNWPACWGHAFCVEGRCRTRAPAEGEACSEIGECAQGLDCVGFESRETSGRCEREYREGAACDEDDALGSCGQWLKCREGRCVFDLSIGKLGAACLASEGDCRGGFCEDGTCVPRRSLGDACTDTAPCQQPYSCIDGACAEPPATCTGEVGDVCTGSLECGLGLVCLNGSPSRCALQTGRQGQPCIEPQHCVDGQCIDGTCVIAPDGDPCETGSECESQFCADGACTVSACR